MATITKIPIKLKVKGTVTVPAETVKVPEAQKAPEPVAKVAIKKKIKTTESVPAPKVLGGAVASVPGLYYYPNFFSTDLAKQLLQELSESKKWNGVMGDEKSRQVIHYGYIYSYTGKNEPLTKTDSIPANYMSLFDMKNSLEGLPVGWKPDQLIINQYLPGQGIAGHIDHTVKFGPIVVCGTLGGGVEIEFTRAGHETQHVYVEPNSLYIMTGDARYEWKHGIVKRKSDKVKGKTIPRTKRVSLTFRVTTGAPK